MHDLVRSEARGVHLLHRELGIGIGNRVCDLLTELIPTGERFGPLSEAALAFALTTNQLVCDGLRQAARQGNAKPGSEGAVSGQAAGEVALHDDRDAVCQIVLDLIGSCEQRGEVETHARLDASLHVDLPSQRLVAERHGWDMDGAPGCRQQRCDGRLSCTT